MKPPGVAGAFYPADAGELRAEIDAYLADAGAQPPLPEGHRVKALIVPHAGYRYSGPVAASAYRMLADSLESDETPRVRRVVLLGPAHRVPVDGFAAPTADRFGTPLGEIALDKEALAHLLELPGVEASNAPFAQEHSLEVQLPFLQAVLGEFALVPLLAGQVDTESAAAVVERLWGGPDTLVVVSSDLSHFLDYATASRRDRATTEAIEQLRHEAIGYEDACGRNPLRGLLSVARERRLRALTLDVRNSGDTAGGKDRVVGYGAYLLSENEGVAKAGLSEEHRRTLLDVARDSIRQGFSRGEPMQPDTDTFAPRIRATQSCFVTLRRSGALCGCIGSVAANNPLVVDVAHNAFAAAFQDPRFEALTEDRMSGLVVSISALDPPQPIAFESEDDLLASLRPGVDGVVIEDLGRRATYLPSVWNTLGEPQRFLAELKRKAGLAPDHWSGTFRAMRYTVESFSG